MTIQKVPVPVLTRGCSVKLVKMPDGYESQHLPLTPLGYYTFLEWSGSNIVITTDDPDITASIHYSRIEYADQEA